MKKLRLIWPIMINTTLSNNIFNRYNRSKKREVQFNRDERDNATGLSNLSQSIVSLASSLFFSFFSFTYLAAFWSANGAVASRGYRLNRRIVPRCAARRGEMRMEIYTNDENDAISSGVEGKTYNGLYSFAVHPETRARSPVRTSRRLYREFVDRSRKSREIATNRISDRPWHVFFIFIHFCLANLKNTERLWERYEIS